MSFVELNGWDAGIQFSASHFIPGHVKCGRLHGHVYGIRLRVHGGIGKNHMIMDFIELKKWLRSIVEVLDHRVLIPELNQDMMIKTNSGRIEITTGEKQYVFPMEDVVLLPIPMCSAEELAKHLLDRCLREIPFPENIAKVELGVDEGKGQGGWASRKLGGGHSG